MLLEGDIEPLLTHLRNGHDFGVEEVRFELLGDDLRVSFRDEQCKCRPDVFIADLERALARETPT